MRQSRTDKIANTKAKLIAAGRAAFAKKGYNNASMDDLTANVGLTRGALYHHFGNKLGLFCAVIEQIDLEIDALIDEATKNIPSLWQRLLAEARIYLQSMQDKEIQQIYMRDGLAVLGDSATWPNQNKYLSLTTSLLKSMMQDGIIYKCDAKALARQINGALHAAAFSIAYAENAEKTYAEAWQAFSLLLQGLAIKPQEQF